jgi:hypothetical protein
MAQAPVSGSEKPSNEAVPMIASSGGPLKLSGMTLISLLTGALALIAAILLSLGLGKVMSETVILPSIIAGAVLGIIAVVCGSLAMDSVREVLMPRRDRLVMLAGPVMVAIGLIAVAFTWGTLASLIIQPDQSVPAKYEDQKPLITTVDVAAVTAVAPPSAAPAVPVTPPATTPSTGADATTPPATGADATTPPTTGADATTPPATGADAKTPPASMPVPETPAGGGATTTTDAASGM